MNYFEFAQWFSRRCRLKIFLIWSSGIPFVQPSRTICAIFVEGIMRNNSVKLFEFGPAVQEEMSFKAISYLAIWRPLVQRSGTICSILEEGIMQEEQFCEIILNFGPVVQEEMLFLKNYLELWRPLYSLERNNL